MTIDTRITKGGKRIPVVAFFGTKGGVGKTTIARRFAELVTLARSSPNVLLVDGDVHHRGMTVEMTSQTSFSCKTVHDYVVSQNVSDIEAVNMSGIIKGARSDSGGLFFIPASTRESVRVFDESAKIGPENLLQVLYKIVSKSVEKYNCDCVVIDCGPIIDPYTATAAMLSDRAFIIGQNEPISFSSLKAYPSRIIDFHPEFTTDKMKVIINKVRGWERLEERKPQEGIFHAIPFTMDIVDVSEGLSAANEMQLMMFENHIAQIVEKVFKGDHPELIPDQQELLPPEWNSLIHNTESLEQTPLIKRLGFLRLLLPIGLLIAVIGSILFYDASTKRHRAERASQAQELVIALKHEIDKAESSNSSSVGSLQESLQLAERVDPDSDKNLAQAVKRAKEAGLNEVPPLNRMDTTRENIGIGILLTGIVFGVIGFSSYQSRKSYLSAIQGLRKGGAKWLMTEMKTKRSARKTFDKLLKMVQ